MRKTIERELKLEAGEGFALPPLPGEPLADRVFTSTYYDTPARSLGRAGITLRRRIEDRRPLWQMKLPRGGTARAELEARGTAARPPAELTALLAVHLRKGALEPIAALRTRRSGIHVVDGGRSVAEVTIDEVDVLEGRRRAGGFVELEIELVDDGEEDDLTRLGRELRHAGARRSKSPSKVRRVAPVEQPPAPSKGATLRALLAYQLRRQLDQLEAHDPGVRLGDFPEDVHRFRVATRRSRSLIRATRAVAGDALAPLAAELGWLAGTLGPVRDLDVLIDRLGGLVAGLDLDAQAAESIVAALEEERQARRTDLLAALDSERYLRLLDAFAEAVDSLPAELEGDARSLAAARLVRLERAADGIAPDSPDEAVHALRIRAKRARYTAELAALAGGRRLARYVEALVEVQDLVGDHQDAVVAEQRLRALASAGRALAAGRLIELERGRRRRARAQLPETVAAAIARGRTALR